jgi:hypothetical protein
VGGTIIALNSSDCGLDIPELISFCVDVDVQLYLLLSTDSEVIILRVLHTKILYVYFTVVL